jgi:hypothetical protein
MSARVYAIYAVSGPAGGYIGCTAKNPWKRWAQHVAQARSGSLTPLHAAIREHGASAFQLEVIGCSGDQREAFHLERMAIRAAQMCRAGLLNTTAGETKRRRSANQSVAGGNAA